jgi:hypothetical protein
MDHVFERSNLADTLEDEPEPNEREGIIRAPNVNSNASRRVCLTRRVFVDSRDRDRARFALANDFRLSMLLPLRGVRSITLTDAYIPIVANHVYVVVVLRNLKDRTLILTKESAGLPGGVLAIIPLIPAVAGAAYTYYRSQTGGKNGGSSVGWRVSMPQGLGQIEDLHVQLYAWSYSAGSATILYPIPADAALPNSPLIGSNVNMCFEIEHDV